MNKTLLLALALGVLAGCADDAPAPVEETDVTVVDPAAPVTEPTDDLVDDPLADDSTMTDDVLEGDAGLDDSEADPDELMDEDAL